MDLLSDNPILFIVILAAIIIGSILIARFIFKVNRHIAAQEATVKLLMRIAEKNGVEQEELEAIGAQFVEDSKITSI